MFFLYNELKNIIYHPTWDTAERNTGAINAETMGIEPEHYGQPLENMFISRDTNLPKFFYDYQPSKMFSI